MLDLCIFQVIFAACHCNNVLEYTGSETLFFSYYSTLNLEQLKALK